MYQLKTQLNDASVLEFLNSVENEKRKSDAFQVLDLMKEVTGVEPKMWGSAIVGFGSYHYKYASGQEADWMMAGFSPRKQSLTIYIVPGYDFENEPMASVLKKLGKYKTGKSCLYINKLEDVDLDQLKALIQIGWDIMSKKY